MTKLSFVLCVISCWYATAGHACSVIYYVDSATNKIYVANNEDYWYDTEPYIQVMPRSKHQLARLWYGWDRFAQGGINEAGLFFDGAVTPEQKIPEGYASPRGNLGDEILAVCKTVEEAIAYLEEHRIALTNAHMIFGDSAGQAVVVEWVNGERRLVPMKSSALTMTNFLLSDTASTSSSCLRYHAMEAALGKLNPESEATLKDVGNVVGKAAQLPAQDETGRIGGTLYSTFIDITDMKFVLVYKLDNARVTTLDLKSVFNKRGKKTIKLG